GTWPRLCGLREVSSSVSVDPAAGARFRRKSLFASSGSGAPRWRPNVSFWCNSMLMPPPRDVCRPSQDLDLQAVSGLLAQLGDHDGGQHHGEEDRGLAGARAEVA